MATISPLSATVPVAACTFGIDPIDDLLLLEKAAQKINSILDLDQLIDKVVNEVAHAFGCVEATIYLHDQARRELVLAGVHGCTRHGKGDRKKVGKEGMVGYVAGTGKMHYAPDVRQDPYYIACEKSTRSEVAIPLQVDGQLVGVFSASHPQLDAFRPEQLRLLEALCAHIAAAIYNARRFQKERREREQMSREAGEARAASLTAQVISLDTGICHYRNVDTRGRAGRGLVRFHYPRREAVGIGLGGRLREGDGRCSAHVRDSRYVAIARRGRLVSGRGTREVESPSGRGPSRRTLCDHDLWRPRP